MSERFVYFCEKNTVCTRYVAMYLKSIIIVWSFGLYTKSMKLTAVLCGQSCLFCRESCNHTFCIQLLCCCKLDSNYSSFLILILCTSLPLILILFLSSNFILFCLNNTFIFRQFNYPKLFVVIFMNRSIQRVK